jgi:hypothetical protein
VAFAAGVEVLVGVSCLQSRALGVAITADVVPESERCSSNVGGMLGSPHSQPGLASSYCGAIQGSGCIACSRSQRALFVVLQ